MADKARIRIALTAEQQRQVAQATGKQIVALELAPELLEERVAPGIILVQRGGGWINPDPTP